MTSIFDFEVKVVEKNHTNILSLGRVLFYFSDKNIVLREIKTGELYYFRDSRGNKITINPGGKMKKNEFEFISKKGKKIYFSPLDLMEDPVFSSQLNAWYRNSVMEFNCHVEEERKIPRVDIFIDVYTVSEEEFKNFVDETNKRYLESKINCILDEINCSGSIDDEHSQKLAEISCSMQQYC